MTVWEPEFVMAALWLKWSRSDGVGFSLGCIGQQGSQDIRSTVARIIPFEKMIDFHDWAEKEGRL